MADLSGAETFADGQNVTGARLNNHVNGATILASFVSNKSSVTPVGADSLLLYQSSSSSLVRSTVTNLQSSWSASPTFTGTTTVNGATVIAGEITPSQITANQDNYNPTGLSTATVLRLSTDASRNITGLQGGIADRVLILHNIGSFNFVLVNASGSSSAANQLAIIRNLTIPPNGMVILQYDATSTKWRSVTSRSGTGIVSYLQFVAPHRSDGTGATFQNSDATKSYFGQVKFTNSAAATANYVEYRFIVPEDLDTSVALQARFKFQLSAADTGKHRYTISVSDVADSAAYAGTLGNAINLDFAGDASGANGDVETVGLTTLTGWAAALTPGHLAVIRIARAGDDVTNDTSTVDSYSGPLELSYSTNQ